MNHIGQPIIASAGRCASCHAELHGPYCAECGEKRLPPGTYGLKQILHDWQTTAALGEGKLIITLRWLLFRPGFLASEYFLGRRVRHTRPAALFLVCNVLFFLLCNWNTFTTPLSAHLRDWDMLHRGAAQAWVKEQVLGDKADPAVWQEINSDLENGDDVSIFPREFTALKAYTLRFNDREAILSRTLIVAIIPITAVLAWALMMFLGESLARQFIFSAHFWSAFLLVLIALNWIYLGAYELVLHVSGYAGLRALLTNQVFSLSLLGVMAVYTWFGLRRFCGYGLAGTTLATGWYLFAAAVSLSLYRSLLFFVTYASLLA